MRLVVIAMVFAAGACSLYDESSIPHRERPDAGIHHCGSGGGGLPDAGVYPVVDAGSDGGGYPPVDAGFPVRETCTNPPIDAGGYPLPDAGGYPPVDAGSAWPIDAPPLDARPR